MTYRTLRWTSGSATWFTAGGAIREPQNPSKYKFWGGSPSPQGLYSPYILWDTTRPRHITYVQVWSKSDQRRLRKTLHKQTNKHYENNGHLAVNQSSMLGVYVRGHPVQRYRLDTHTHNWPIALPGPLMWSFILNPSKQSWVIEHHWYYYGGCSCWQDWPLTKYKYST